jgi:PAS domain S-box-containing protein
MEDLCLKPTGGLNDPSPLLYAAQRSLLDEMAAGLSLCTTLEHLVRSIEHFAPGLVGSILLVEGTRLRLAAAPSLPPAYNEVVDGTPIGEGFGSCGTAAFRREMVVVEDILADHLWQNYRDIARRYGLGACWSTPILSRSREVIGTFALYYSEPRRPHPDEIRLIEEFSAFAGLVVEHHFTEQRRRATETWLDELAEDLDTIIWEAEEAGEDGRRFTYVSQGAVEMLGYSLQRWFSEPGFWQRHIHPEDRAETLRRFRDGLRANEKYDAEYRMVAVDSRIVWFRDFVCPMRYAHGTSRMRGVMANITRQREAEEEREVMARRLVDERSLLGTVLEQVPEGVVIVDAHEGRVLMANRRAKEYLNVPLAPEASLPDAVALRAVRDGVTVPDEEMQVSRGDGRSASLAVSAAPIRNREGQIVAGVSVLVDVTEHKRQMAAQRLLADAGSIVGSSLDPELAAQELASLATLDFADWCAAFVRTGKCCIRCAALSCRDRAKEALKPELDRLLLQPGGAPFELSTVLATGQSKLFSELAAEHSELGAARHDLLRLVRSLGAESAITVALHRPGQTFGAVVFARGCADGRYAAEDLVVAEALARRTSLALDNGLLYREAQDAIRQREEFLAVAAHELRTPLAALQLNLDFLTRQIGNSPIDSRSVLPRAVGARAQGTQLAHLIDDLLDISRIRAGRLRLEPQTVDLVGAVQHVVSGFHDELVAKGVEVAVHAPSPVVGCWDPARIEQVITNLVSNGIKYGAGRAMQIAVETKDGRALLRVEDHGIGMTPAVLQRLFKPFERGVPPGHFRGLGLGLYIAAQIVEAHGGSISARSTPGEGSTLRVELPIRGPSFADPESSPCCQPNRR